MTDKCNQNDAIHMHINAARVVFEIQGDGTMSQCSSLRRCAEHCIEAGCEVMRFDLSQCIFIDSTFVGTLIHLKRLIAKKEHGSFALIQPADTCVSALRNMGILDYICVVDEPPSSDDGVSITATRDDTDTLQRTIVEAHQELAGVPGPAAEQFRRLAKRLALEYESTSA